MQNQTRGASKIEIINGAIANMDRNGTPTFLPQCLQVAGIAGPRHIFLQNEILSSLQCGHVNFLNIISKISETVRF